MMKPKVKVEKPSSYVLLLQSILNKNKQKKGKQEGQSSNSMSGKSKLIYILHVLWLVFTSSVHSPQPQW